LTAWPTHLSSTSATISTTTSHMHLSWSLPYIRYLRLSFSNTPF
jgi:hypothetical protein